MKKYTSIGLSIFILVSVTVSLLLWVRAFNQSVRSYRSPLPKANLSPQSSTPPQTNKVVMVLISGLGYDDSLALNLPVLEQFRRTGANAAIQSTPPTYSQTDWATVISGAPSESNDAPPFDVPSEDLHLLAVDTMFARAHEAQLQTALLGNADWRKLIPPNQLNYTVFMEDQGPQADEIIFESALPIIRDNNTNLVLIHFSQIDFAAKHQGGASGQAYQEAARQIDAYLDEIRAGLDLNNAVLLILADHGHIPSGGHGGNEVEVVWQPFTMMGQAVISGSYSDIHQTDLAPTVSALLGLPPPAAAQGRILFEMLRLSEYDRAVAQLSLAHQRLALANAYAAQLGDDQTSSLDRLAADLAQAQTSFDSNNINGAYQLAQLAQQEADTLMRAVRRQKIWSNQLQRLPLILLVVFVWFMTLWRRRGVHAASIIIAAIVTIALYHALYQLQGYSYSLSSFANFSALPTEVARRTAVSLLIGGGLLLIFLMLTNEDRWKTLLGTGYGFSVLVTSVFLLPFFWGYWQNGLTVTWHLPAVTPVFWQLTSALEALVSAGLGLILPWPIMILSLFINVTRRRLSQTRSRPEPDALPSLRL